MTLLYGCKHLKKALALGLSVSLLWTSGVADAALEATHVPPARPAELELAPPPSLGRITDFYKSPTDSKRVILVQDLHAHYGVQKNIAAILDFLAKKTPFTLAVEGASGPIDSSVMALFPDVSLKQEASDYLMREGELTGAEYFAVMHGLPAALTGVEDERYYTIHRDLFRQTFQDRSRLVDTLQGIQADLLPLRKLAAAQSRDEKDLLNVEHDLDLLLRVANLQATEQEVRDFGPRLNQFTALAKSLTSAKDETALRQLISSSIDYYVMAFMRNKPMIDNTLRLLKSPGTAVLVAGGFHTAPMTQMLREKNVSYLVITPAVDHVSDADHALYVKRLRGERLSNPDIASAASSHLAVGIYGKMLVDQFLTYVTASKRALRTPPSADRPGIVRMDPMTLGAYMMVVFGVNGLVLATAWLIYLLWPSRKQPLSIDLREANPSTPPAVESPPEPLPVISEPAGPEASKPAPAVPEISRIKPTLARVPLFSNSKPLPPQRTIRRSSRESLFLLRANRLCVNIWLSKEVAGLIPELKEAAAAIGISVDRINDFIEHAKEEVPALTMKDQQAIEVFAPIVEDWMDRHTSFGIFPLRGQTVPSAPPILDTPSALDTDFEPEEPDEKLGTDPTALTHPDTYLAGIIKYQLGPGTYWVWRFFRFLGRKLKWAEAKQEAMKQPLTRATENRRGLVLSEPLKWQLTRDERQWIEQEFSPVHEQKHFWSKYRADKFVLDHPPANEKDVQIFRQFDPAHRKGADIEHLAATQLAGGRHIAWRTYEGAKEGLKWGFISSMAFNIADLPIILALSRRFYPESNPFLFSMVLTIPIIIFIFIPAVGFWWGGHRAGVEAHRQYSKNPENDGAELTSALKPGPPDWRKIRIHKSFLIPALVASLLSWGTRSADAQGHLPTFIENRLAVADSIVTPPLTPFDWKGLFGKERKLTPQIEADLREAILSFFRQLNVALPYRITFEKRRAYDAGRSRVLSRITIDPQNHTMNFNPDWLHQHPWAPGNMETTLLHEAHHLSFTPHRERIVDALVEKITGETSSRETALWRRVFAILHKLEEADATNVARSEYRKRYGGDPVSAVWKETDERMAHYRVLYEMDLKALAPDERAVLLSILPDKPTLDAPIRLGPWLLEPATGPAQKSSSEDATNEADVNIAAEGSSAPTHVEVNKAIESFRRNGQFEELSDKEKQGILRIIRRTDSLLAADMRRNSYRIFLYGDETTLELIPGQTSHAGIHTKSIHLAKGTYLSLKERDMLLGRASLAGRIAHEAYEIFRWRQFSYTNYIGPDQMRMWIKTHLNQAKRLNRFFHLEGIRIERTIARTKVGSEIPIDDPEDINIANGLENSHRSSIGMSIWRGVQRIRNWLDAFKRWLRSLKDYPARQRALLTLVTTAHAASRQASGNPNTGYDGRTLHTLMPNPADQKEARKTRQDLFMEALRRSA